MKYERPATTKVSVKQRKEVISKPHVGRIEDMKVEETPKEKAYPLEPHIGSLLVKTAPTDEEELRELVSYLT